jgi:nucleoside 2-deoxyribosyltransferase
MMNVYLAGPITGCSYEETVGWRNDVIDQLADNGINAYSPMRGKDFLLDVEEVADCYDEEIRATSKAITKRDKWDCDRADVLLVNLLDAERISIGTMIELGWASRDSKPVILAMTDKSIHQHPMVREIAMYIFPTLEEAVEQVIVLNQQC